MTGAFPLLGVPEIYQSGVMLLLGILTAALALSGALCLARKKISRLIFGCIASFFCIAGLIASYRYGAEAINYASIGGGGWFAAVAMGCYGMMGLLFFGIFGYLLTRFMTRNLWLAIAHLSLGLIALGAYLDFCFEERASLTLATSSTEPTESVITPDGRELALGFGVRAKTFKVSYYPSPYGLYERQGNAWKLIATLEDKDGILHHGEESWDSKLVKTNLGMGDQAYLALPASSSNAMRLITREPATVKNYEANCEISHRKGKYDLVLRVNEPIERQGWGLSLINFKEIGNQTIIQIQARSAPGRLIAMSGMIGLIISIAASCWWRKEDILLPSNSQS